MRFLDPIPPLEVPLALLHNTKSCLVGLKLWGTSTAGNAKVRPCEGGLPFDMIFGPWASTHQGRSKVRPCFCDVDLSFFLRLVVFGSIVSRVLDTPNPDTFQDKRLFLVLCFAYSCQFLESCLLKCKIESQTRRIQERKGRSSTLSRKQHVHNTQQRADEGAYCNSKIVFAPSQIEAPVGQCATIYYGLRSKRPTQKHRYINVNFKFGDVLLSLRLEAGPQQTMVIQQGSARLALGWR